MNFFIYSHPSNHSFFLILLVNENIKIVLAWAFKKRERKKYEIMNFEIRHFQVIEA